MVHMSEECKSELLAIPSLGLIPEATSLLDWCRTHNRSILACQKEATSKATELILRTVRKKLGLSPEEFSEWLDGTRKLTPVVDRPSAEVMCETLSFLYNTDGECRECGYGGRTGHTTECDIGKFEAWSLTFSDIRQRRGYPPLKQEGA